MNLMRDVRGHHPPQLPFLWGVREVLRDHDCQGTRNPEILVVAGTIEDSEVSGSLKDVQHIQKIHVPGRLEERSQFLAALTPGTNLL